MAQVFKKRFPNNPVNLTTGKAVRFEDVGNNMGFYVTDKPDIIAEFELCMQAGRGGIQRSDITEYDEAIKKKLSSPNLANKLREHQTAGLVTLPTIPIATPVEAAVANPVAAVAVSAVPASPAPEPRVGKRAAQK